MQVKVAFVNKITGLIENIAIPANEKTYPNGANISDVYIARHIPINTNNEEVIATWHWDENTQSFAIHERKPNASYDWDSINKIWTVAITRYRQEKINNLKGLTTIFINQTAGFSQEKQTLYSFRYSELNTKLALGTIIPPEQTELTNIQSLVDWYTTVNTARTNALNNISNTASIQAIDAIVNTFSLPNPPFSP